MPAAPPTASVSPNFHVKYDGTQDEKFETDLQSFVIERDMFQPDMATLVMNNQGGEYSVWKLGAELEIFVGDEAGASVYKGEIVGLEPIYRGGEQSRIVVRAMNRFHRLLRMRKSVTFTEKTDQQILQQICSNAGLTLEWKHEKSIVYKHVYQHNQTDMEFLRMRAARMGCHVWCVDKKVFIKEPDLQQQPTVKLNVVTPQDPSAPSVKSFTPRLSTTNILKKVTVKGWNPETKELIVGDSSAQASKLGPTNAVTAARLLAAEETFTVDHPIWSKEEAVALAKARLVDMSLGFITGECEVSLDPGRTLGEVVSITVNPEAATDPFNGRYYVMGVTHRFGKKENGYTTVLRVARDAQEQVSADVQGGQQQAGAA